MNIEPSHLTNLLAIAQHGSFNRAAAAVGLSQPGLSYSIAQLERRLGVVVLQRTRQGSELTEFGKILVASAQTLTAVMDHAKEQIRQKKLGINGPLRVGAVPSILIKFMPEVLAAFCERHPKVQVVMREGLDDELLPLLQSGHLDLIVTPVGSLNWAASGITELPLFEDVFSIGVGHKSSLKRRKSVALQELQDASWVLPPEGAAYRRTVEALLLAARMTMPLDSVVTSNLSLTESLIALTDRVGLVTALQVKLNNPSRIRSIPLKNGGGRTLGIKWRTTGQLAPLAAAFVDITKVIARNGDYSGGRRLAAS